MSDEAMLMEKLPDRRTDKVERHIQTALIGAAVTAAIASVALMISLDKSLAVFSERMDVANTRLGTLENKMETYSGQQYEIDYLKSRVEQLEQGNHP